MHLYLIKAVSYPKSAVNDYCVQEGSVTITLQIQSSGRKDFLQRKQRKYWQGTMKPGTFAGGADTLEPLDHQPHQSYNPYRVAQARSPVLAGRKYMHLYLTKAVLYPNSAVGDYYVREESATIVLQILS